MLVREMPRCLFLFVNIIALAACSEDIQPEPRARRTSEVVGGRAETGYSGAGYVTTGSSTVPRCGATLISRDIALTAAHCVAESNAYGFGVGAVADENIVPARAVIGHPQYRPDTGGPGEERYRFDIAVMKLEREAPGDPLPMGTPAVDGNALSIGYGRVSYGGVSRTDGFTNERKSVDFTITRVESTNIFATAIEGGNCWGDSGGPLIDKDAGTLLGVLADFDEVFDCRTGNRMIYTSIAGTRDFIVDAIAKLQSEQ